MKIAYLGTMTALMFIHWSPDPIAFEIGPLAMSWYGMCWGGSIIGSYYLLRWLLRRENIHDDRLVNIVILYAIFALIGARLGQVIFYDLSYFSDNPSEIVKVWHGGLASHGGVIGGFIALTVIPLIYKEVKFWSLTDATAVVMPFVGGLIRFGNLMNSELVGKPTEVSWAFIFERVDDVPRHPAVLYESVMLFALFGLFIWIYRQRKWPIGFFTGLFLSLVFFFRLILESTKASSDYLTIFGWQLSWTQCLSIPVILIGCILLLLSCRDKVPRLKA